MKIRLTLLSALLAVSAFAADVTGKWSAEVQGRGGQTRQVTINLKASGDALTGTISGPQGDTEISDGKVSADEVSFNVTREFQGNTVKMHYTGKVAGDEIKFTVTREGGQGGGRGQEFTAKRSTT
jgi:hypothetical protein